MPFRPYTPADRAACLALFDRNVAPYFDPSERAQFERFLSGNPQPYFVLEDVGEVVACGGVALHPDGAAGVALRSSEAGLTWGMVARHRHGQGLGKQLVAYRLDWLRAQHPEVTEARIATSQHTRPFYEHLGFQVESVTPDGFAPGIDEVRMALSLAQS